jgi:hypothetical protein
MRLAITPVVLAVGSFANPGMVLAEDWAVRCNRDGVCAPYVDSVRVPLGGDAGSRRGTMRCAEQDEWLACTWRHTTQLHLNEGYFIHLPTRRARQMNLETLAMDETGAYGRLLGRPRWQGDGVRLMVEKSARHHWIWRRRPREPS